MIEQAIRVLSIEDNPAEAMLIQEKLAEAQRIGWDLPRFEIEHVDRLEAALTRLKADGVFDVVLSDLDLPDSQAGETVATLREHIPHMPLVVLTGREDEVLAHKSVRAGVQDYLYKNEATGSLLARSMMYAIERQQAHDELERHVEERTADLQAEISERKRTEDALRESEERYRRLVELSPDLIAIHLEGKILYINEAGANLLDISDPAKVIGKSITEFVTLDRRDISEERMRRLMKEGQQSPLYEQTIVRPDGTERNIEVVGIPFTHQDGTAVQIIAHDVTERKQAEERMEHLNRVLRTISNVNQLIIKETDRGRLIQGVCDKLTETHGYHNAWIALLDDAGESVTAFESGLGADFAALREQLHRGELNACGQQALSQSEVVATEDPASTCTDCPLTASYAGRGAMTVRLEHDGDVYGLLTVSVPAHFTTDEEERSLFQEVAGDVAFALHSIELEEKRKRADAALQRSEARYHALVEGAEETVATVNEEGIFLFMNSAAAQQLGGKPEDFIGQTMWDLFPPEDADVQVSNIQRVIQTKERMTVEAPTILQGNERWYRTSIQPIHDPDDEVSVALLIARDITERKQAEEKLRMAEETYRNVFLNAQVGMFRTDVKTGLVLDANDAVARFVGYRDREEMLSEPFSITDRYVNPGDREKMISLLRANGKFTDFEAPFRRNNGSIIIMRYSARLVPDKGWIEGISVDVTKEMQAIEALRASEVRLSAILRYTPAIIYLKDRQGRFTLINRAFEKALGVSHDETLGKTAYDLVPAEMAAEHQAHDEQVMRTGRPLQIEESAIEADGQKHTVLSTKFPMYGPDGELLGVGGISADITERKQTEQALRESEARFRTIVNALPQFIAYTDKNLVYRFVNQTYQEKFDVEPEEVVGKSLIEVIGEEAFEEAQPHVEKALQGEHVRYHERYDYAIGGTRDVDGILVPDIAADGEVRGYYAVLTDITPYMEMQEELRQTTRRFQALLDYSPALVHIFDENGRYLLVSKASAKAVGLPREEVVGKTFADLLPPETVATFMRRVEALKEDRAVLSVDDQITVNGEDRFFESLLFPLADEAGVATYASIATDVTARKRAEDALKESLTRYADITARVLVGVYVFWIRADGEMAFEYVSDRWCEIHQLRRKDVLADVTVVNDLVHPDDQENFMALNRQAHSEQTRFSWEGRFIIGGETRWVQIESTCEAFANGDTRWFGVTQDITERKRAEQALQQRNRRLAELNAIVSSLTSTLSLEQVLQRILEATPQFFSQEHSATIQLLEGDGNLHQRATSNNIPSEKLQNIFRPGEGIAGRVVQEQRPINVADVTAEPDYLPGPIPPYYRSLLVVPLIAHSQPMGTLSLSSKGVEAFDDRDIEMLQGLASYASIAVYNAQLYEQTRRDAETKGLLLREVNHRVKNNLNAIIGLLYVERRHAPPEALPAYRPIMEDLIQRITGLSEVHQMLSGGEWAPLNLGELAERIIQITVKGAQEDVEVALDVSSASVYVQAAQAQHLTLILSELTTNTLKHAAAGRDTVQIAVRISQENDVITLIYRNDGPGYPEDVLRLERHSAGLDIVKRSVRKNLRGELTLRNEGGAVTEIRFKKEE